MGCSSSDSSSPRPRPTAPARLPAKVGKQPATVSGKDQASPLRFVDVADSAGLHFRHYSPLTEQRHVHLFLGSGIGWLDFDRDGWPDLYCGQGAAYQAGKQDRRAGSEKPATNALFRNQAGSAFIDVTRQAGLWNTSYSMGVAAADFDNDGFVDLCVTGYEENFLFRNNGDGCFTRIELPREKQPGRLSASCTWADIDADGNLDLFVTNYARLGPDNYPLCQHTSAGVTIPISCHPLQLDAMHDLLYWNTGAGEFTEISADAGIVHGKPLPGLGVIAADLDQDGDSDFYVANDTTPNHLWENQGNGTFLDRGAESGTSRNRHGDSEAGMGLAAGDVQGNGRIDLFVTNYYHQTNTLYRNEGGLLFSDVTEEMGLAGPSRLRLGFGTSLADFDNDSWLDLMVANGHVQDRLHEIQRDEPFAQLPQVFHNQHGVRFRDVSTSSGDYFQNPHVARSTAVADFDGDGDLDVAINCLNSPAALLKNAVADRQHWLRVELIGLKSNRAGVGCLLRLDLGERVIFRCIQAGTGYLSNDEAITLIGLGRIDEVLKLTVVWPNGRREAWGPLRADRLWRLLEGSGQEAQATVPSGP